MHRSLGTGPPTPVAGESLCTVMAVTRSSALFTATTAWSCSAKALASPTQKRLWTTPSGSSGEAALQLGVVTAEFCGCRMILCLMICGNALRHCSLHIRRGAGGIPVGFRWTTGMPARDRLCAP